MDPVEFALADLQAPDAGPVVRIPLTLPAALARLAPVLFPGAPVETGPRGPCVRLTATDRAACGSMAASLGLVVG